MKPALLIIFLLASPALLAQVSVGWDAGCDFNINSDADALQTALDAGHAEIRLSHAQSHTVAIEITSNVVLRGGYANCSEANADQQTNINAIIDASGFEKTAVRITGIDLASVRLEYLTITGGDGSSASSPGSGGVLVANTTGEVTLHHLDIHNNTGGWGGGGMGITANSLLEDGQLDVTATETVIRDNSASNGGGLYCSSFHTTFDIYLWLSDGSVIQANHATTNGGAIYTDRCRISHLAGVATHSLSTDLDKEIHANTSDESGGGVTVFNTARMVLQGNGAEAFDLTANASNLDPSASGQGGAAQVSNGGELELFNARVSYNSSGRYGGALMANFGGLITLASDPAGCSYHRYCSQMIGNSLSGTLPGGGGVMAAHFGGQIRIYNAFLWLNNAETQGYIGFAQQSHNDQPASLLLEGNVIVENGISNDYANPTAFQIGAGAELTLAYNTLRQNRTTSTLLSQLNDSSLQAFGNIIHEFSNIHQASGTTTTTISCNLVRNQDSIEVPVTDLLEGTVSHLDIANHDYRLAAGDTLAIDVCAGGLYSPLPDLGGQPRGTDHPGVDDLNGPFDLGAYEFDVTAIDAIFADDFGI